MELDLDWEFVADTVMGGVSSGRVARMTVAGRDAHLLTGEVSLDNDGGFIQMAADLAPDGAPVDLSNHAGLAFDARGNGETYELRLRTADLTRPWQSYRMPFTAPPDWTTIEAPFDALEAHRTDAPFDPAKVRRIGILAIGREYTADVAITAVRLLATKP